MTKLRAILLIFAVTLLTYGNSLKNDFIGDDKALFVGNDFYKTPANLVRLFRPDFITDHSRFSNTAPFSGCVSYRPVTALTFFFDYVVWKENPFGHHLTNVLLHALAAVLVFLLIEWTCGQISLSLLAALLFAVHPIQAEAVNVVGYRSDLIATAAYLAAFFFYLRFTRGGPGGPRWLVFSYLSFFTALFAKENAVPFPFVLVLYDCLFPAGPAGAAEKRRAFFGRIKYYAGFLAILTFYLIVYFFVFPSAFYPKMPLLGGTPASHLGYIAQIFLLYLKAIVWPAAVHTLAPLDLPPPPAAPAMEIAAALAVVSALLAGAAFAARRRPVVTFAILWFLANYFLVSNVLTLLNPYAYRFVYLPSVGAFWLIALGVDKITAPFEKKLDSPVKWAAAALIIAVLVSQTLRLNRHFRNDVTACLSMIRHYPDSPQPYWVLGHHYYITQNYEKAAGYFEQFLQKKTRNPFISPEKQKFMALHLLGRSYTDRHPAKAVEALAAAIAIFDGEPVLFADLSKAYISAKDYENALASARRAYTMNPRLGIAYVYAVHALVETGRLDEAFAELEKAKQIFPGDPNVKIVEDYLNSKQ